MRWILRMMAAGLLAASFAAAPLFAQPAKAGAIIGEPTCGDHGTNIHFEKSPKDAAAKALKEEKLVMVLHISGLFEDPDYT